MYNIFIILTVTIAILSICIVAMSVRIWCKKNGTFPETEISRNKEMKKLGIKCAKQEELELLNKNQRNSKFNCECCQNCITRNNT